MTEDSLQEEVEKIKKWIKRRKRITLIKYAIYAVIIIGVIVWGYQVNLAAGSMEFDYRIRGVDYVNIYTYKIRIEVDINNPSSVGLEVEDLIYQIYIQDAYVGEGYERLIKIEPQKKTTHRFDFELSLRNLPQIIQKNIASQGEIEVKIKGRVTVPLKAYDLFTWKRITVPLDSAQKFNIRNETRSALKSTFPVTLEDVQAIIKNELSSLNGTVLTKEDVEQIVQKATEALLTRDEVEAMISDELAELQQRLETVEERLRISR